MNTERKPGMRLRPNHPACARREQRASGGYMLKENRLDPGQMLLRLSPPAN